MLPAETTASAAPLFTRSMARPIELSFLRRTDSTGGSFISMTSLAWTTSMRLSVGRVAQLLVDAGLVAHEVELGDFAVTAQSFHGPRNDVPGAESPPIASMASLMAGLGGGYRDDLSAFVRPQDGHTRWAAPARRIGNTWTVAAPWDGAKPCECAGAFSTFYVLGHPWEMLSVTSISGSSYPTHASADRLLTAYIGTALYLNPCHNAGTIPATLGIRARCGSSRIISSRILAVKSTKSSPFSSWWKAKSSTFSGNSNTRRHRLHRTLPAR